MSRLRLMLVRLGLPALVALGWAMPGHAESAAAAADNGKVIQMEPYKVRAAFDVRGKYKKGTKIIDYAKITWAAPGFIKAGAKVGDFLVSIDGKPVSGMSGAELTALMDITLDPDVKRTFIFKGKRGLLGQTEWTTTAEFVGNQPKPTAAEAMTGKPGSKPVPPQPAQPKPAAVDFF